MTRCLKTLLIACAILVLLAGLLGPAGPDTAAAKIEPTVLAQLDHAGQGAFLVVLAAQADLAPAYQIRDWDERGWFVYHTLREVADRTQPAVLQALHSLESGGHVTAAHPYWIVNVIVVHGDATAARALARRPDVAAVYPEMKITLVEPVRTGPADPAPQAVEWNIAQIGADQVWATYGVSGTGAVVANIDTGVEYSHPALVAQYRGNLGGGNFDHNYNWWDPTFQYTYPYPVEGSHGTHVMGTEVGDDGAGNQIGVAPGARWIAAYGCCPSNEALLSATQWMIAPTDLAGNNPDPAQRPHAVNNSWSGPGGSLIYNSLLEAQQAAGIFVAFAAANNGPQCGTMGSPGDNPGAFSTGATGPDDQIASFSSRGPAPFQTWMGLYGTGPDVCAPGTSIRSSIPGGGYGTSQGTSMASPHTAGAVGLLWSVEPDMIGRVAETEELLRRTAVPLTAAQECGGVPGSNIPNNTYGWGRIDVKAAADMIWHAGTLQGTVTDQASGSPIEGARIGMLRNGYVLTTRTDAAGHYEYLLGEGVYTVTVQAYGYAPWVQGGIGILQDNPSTLNVPLVRLPQYALSGTVAEGSVMVPGEPLDALVGLYNTPALVSTDLPSGWYTVTPALGAYWMRTTARGYVPDNRIITVTTALTEEVNLLPRWTYYVRDSRSPCGPAFAWVDATDGNQLCLGDDASMAIAPGLPFTYYGVSYDNYWISSNGFVSFGAGYSRGHMMFPFEGRPNNAIYAFEEDLNPANCAQGTVYWKVVGNRYVVIEFHEVEHWASGYPETFEFIFDTQRGTIKVQYLEVSWPDFASVGLENADGSDGLMYSYANSAAITDGLAVGFAPVYGRLPADQGPLGVLGTLSGTVYITGTSTPVPGAVVTAMSYLHTLTTSADLDGNYLFPNVCADIYWLQAAAPDYHPGPAVEARLRWSGDVAVRSLYLEPGQAEPSLLKEVSPVGCGEPFTYTIHYANAGDAGIVGAVISDVLPLEVFYITSTPPGVYRDGVVTWTVDIPAGGSGEAAIVAAIVVPPAEAFFPVTNTAYLLWDGPTVAAQAAFDLAYVDLHLTKTVVPAAVQPGGLVTYTLSYANMGCDLAFGAVLTDVIPAEVVYITSTPPGVYRDGVLSWTLNLEYGQVGQATVIGWLTTTAAPGMAVTNTAALQYEEDRVTATASFHVLPAGCEAVQIIAITPTIVSCAVSFEAGLTGTAPFAYLWAFGDGITSTAALPLHTYAQTGTYSGTLDVWNCAGGGHAAMPFVVEVACGYAIYLPVVTKAFTP